MLKKILIALSLVVVAVVIGYLIGPRPSFEKVDNIPLLKTFDISQLDQYVTNKESIRTDIKDDNEARIIWADSTKQKTALSIVYLHGFSASQAEGAPIHTNLASELDANLYLPRLHGHGIDDENAMHDLTPKILVDDAKEAIAIAKTLGEQVIVMGCSTGGTLAIYLAANDPELAAIILLSPNIAIKTSSSKLLTGPWGRQLAYKLVGKQRKPSKGSYSQYWSNGYSTNGLIALQALIDQTMIDEVFEKVTSPVYCGYYYKNEKEQDHVVSVPAMLDFKEELSLPADDIEFEAFPEAGHHVISSKHKNPNWQNVQDEVLDFVLREVLD